MAKKNGQTTPPWFQTSFDLEGLGFGGLALVLAIICGGIPWVGPLLSFVFWVAFAGILLASRKADRTSPSGNELVLAPVDGVIADITSVSPPRELRWDTQEVKRVRISSSPMTVNDVRAPLTGNVESFIEEAGAPSALALKPDNPELREAFILFSSEDNVAGVRVATGGLGPRLDIDLEAGDGVRSGRVIGVRRLGGWCDVFLPIDADVSLEVGMSVIGGETVLSNVADVDTSVRLAPEPVVEEPVEDAPAPEVEAVENAVDEVLEEAKADVKDVVEDVKKAD